MEKVKYGLIGFGGIAENRIAKEGFACDTARFEALENAVLVGATDVNPARQAAAEALGLKWYNSSEEMIADPELDAIYSENSPVDMEELMALCDVFDFDPEEFFIFKD